MCGAAAVLDAKSRNGARVLHRRAVIRLHSNHVQVSSLWVRVSFPGMQVVLLPNKPLKSSGTEDSLVLLFPYIERTAAAEDAAQTYITRMERVELGFGKVHVLRVANVLAAKSFEEVKAYRNRIVHIRAINYQVKLSARGHSVNARLVVQRMTVPFVDMDVRKSDQVINRRPIYY